MIEYKMNNGNSTLVAKGTVLVLCAETNFMIRRLYLNLGHKGEAFKRILLNELNDPHSMVFRWENASDNPLRDKSSDAWDNATEKATAKSMENAMENATDKRMMDGTAWQEEMDLYEDAVKHFGETAQIMQAIEEMAELIQALNKYLRYIKYGHGNLVDALKKIQEERADVEIMLNQLEVIFGDNSETELAKLEHLKKLLEPVKTWEI